MTLSPGASITIDPRAFIVVGGNVVIPGGQTFSADRPPIATGKGNVTVTKWVSFHFSCNNEPVIPFLETTLTGVERIVSVLAKA